MQPLNMYFNLSEYMKPFKLSAKCYITRTVDFLRAHLKSHELDWFLGHPQFKHFFHMPKDAYHKLMGMWMLLLRTASLEKKNECWFIVSDILKEMALISGLYFHEYPRDMETLGSNEFVGKHFGVVTTIRYDDVQAKLLSMKRASPDRVTMAVLYFFFSVLIGMKKPGKQAPSVEPFFLRAIDDLDMCKMFPWGRLAFDENMKDIFHCMNHFGGVLSINQWVFPSFVIPLEVPALEAILVLKENFRKGVSNAHAHRHCPRMCKMKFNA
ncbi:hypothetical protein CARUB_v10006892mg, partial [Capsella rubella]